MWSTTGTQHVGCCSQPQETLMDKNLGQNWVHLTHQTSKPCYTVAVSCWASVLMHTDTRAGCSCCTHSAAQSQKYLQQQRHQSSNQHNTKGIRPHRLKHAHGDYYTQTGQPHAGAAPVRDQTIHTHPWPPASPVAKLPAARHHTEAAVHPFVNLAGHHTHFGEAAADAVHALGRSNDAQQNDLVLPHTPRQQHLRSRTHKPADRHRRARPASPQQTHISIFLDSRQPTHVHDQRCAQNGDRNTG